jgi:hypothetical protein
VNEAQVKRMYEAFAQMQDRIAPLPMGPMPSRYLWPWELLTANERAFWVLSAAALYEAVQCLIEDRLRNLLA